MKLYFAMLVVRDKTGKQIGDPHHVDEPFAFHEHSACEIRIEEVSRDEAYLAKQKIIIACQLPIEFTLTTEMRVFE